MFFTTKFIIYLFSQKFCIVGRHYINKETISQLIIVIKLQDLKELFSQVKPSLWTLLIILFLIFSAKSGTQIVIPYRGTDDDVRHLRVMGDLGQIVFLVSLYIYTLFKGAKQEGDCGNKKKQ